MPTDGDALTTVRAYTHMQQTLQEIEAKFGIQSAQAAAGGYLDGLLQWMEENIGSKPTYRDLELRAEEIGCRVTNNYKKLHKKGDPA